MKRDIDQAKLLDALLTDETWQSSAAQLHENALATLRAAKRSRARRLAIAQGLALLALLAAIGWRFMAPERGWPSRSARELASISRPSLNPAPSAPAVSQGTATPEPYITEDQMLAMFPKGTCILAEVNGEKQLVLLDEKQTQ